MLRDPISLSLIGFTTLRTDIKDHLVTRINSSKGDLPSQQMETAAQTLGRRGVTSRCLLERYGLRGEHLHVCSDVVLGFETLLDILRVSWRNKSWERKFTRWLIERLDVVTREVRELGVPKGMRNFKAFLASLRERALDGTRGSSCPLPKGISRVESRRLLMQVSRVSRSLRAPEGDVLKEALDQHRNVLSGTFETPLEDLQSIRAFAREMSRGATVSFGTLSEAASYQRVTSRGGALEELREIVDAFRAKLVSHLEVREMAARLPQELFGGHVIADWSRIAATFGSHYRASGSSASGRLIKLPLEELLFTYDKRTEVSLEDWEVTREHLFALAACSIEVNLEELPRCRQSVIAERGYKTRVVTPGEAPFMYLLSVVNKGLLDMVKQHPALASSQLGRPVDHLDWSEGRRYGLVFSADLKSATDLVPQDLAAAVVDTLVENWPPYLAALARRSVGQFRMGLSKDLGGGELVTTRGIQMGVPTSWPVLNLYSAWLHKASGSDGWFSVCGDDYLGCHTYASYRKYLAARTRTGAVGSPGKDILSRESVGVFAEELVTVGRCRVLRTLPIRPLTGLPKDSTPAWRMGQTISALFDGLGWTPLQVDGLVRRRFRTTFQLLTRMGVEPVGPRWCGCAGFPGIPSTRTLLTARRIISQSPSQIIDWLRRFGVAWSQAPSSYAVLAMTEDKMNRLAGEGLPLQFGERAGYNPVSDLVSELIGAYSFAAGLAQPASREARAGGISLLSRTIKGLTSEVDQKGYWVNSGRVRDSQSLWAKVHEVTPCLPVEEVETTGVFVYLPPCPSVAGDVGLPRGSNVVGGEPVRPKRRHRLSSSEGLGTPLPKRRKEFYEGKGSSPRPGPGAKRQRKAGPPNGNPVKRAKT